MGFDARDSRPVRRLRAARRDRGTVALGAALLLLVLALSAAAQPVGKPVRIGVLIFSTPDNDPNVRALQKGLRDLGYVEGRNLILEYRYAEGQPERLRDLAGELVRIRPDVIVALGGDVAPAVKSATTTIPVVAIVSDDPVQSGLVASFPHPGGNVTGLSLATSDLAGLRLQMLREAVPSMTRVAVLWNPLHREDEFSQTSVAARRLGIELQSLEVRRAGDFDAAFETAQRTRSEAIIVVSSRLMLLNHDRIVDFATKHRVPVVAAWGPWALTGALLTYGPDVDEVVRRAAAYVDRIVKGAKPADLPFEQPTKHRLVINARAAKALGLTVPPSLLLRADRVIE
jgi:putative tryptophan/tyrosine transport system substrate-binding protein